MTLKTIYDSRPAAFLLRVFMDAKSDEIVDIYYKCRNAYILQPGEILLLDNHKVVHGRSVYQPKFDGNDRFIIRSFIMNDLQKIAGKTHGERTVKCRWS